MSDAAPQAGVRADRAGSERTADLALLSVALIWGVNIPVMKFAIETVHPLGFNVVRLTFSAIVLGLMAFGLSSAGSTRPAWRRLPWGRIFIVSLLGSGVYQALFLLAMDRTTAGNTALLIASSPIWTAAIARLLRIESLSARAWLGLFVAFAGTVVVTLEGGNVQLVSAHLFGNLLVVGAAIMWATSTVLVRPIVDEVPPTLLAYLSSVMSLPIHFLLAAPFARESLDAATATAWWCAAYSGVFSTGLAYAFWNFGVRRVGPSHTAVFTNLVPVVARNASFGLIS